MENNDFNNNYNNGNNGYNNGGNGDNPKTLAIVGFVLSFFISLAGLIVSAIALKKYNETGYTDGKGFATAGLVISIICLAFSVLAVACNVCIAIGMAAGGM